MKTSVGILTGNTFPLRKVIKSYAIYTNLTNEQSAWHITYGEFGRFRDDYPTLAAHIGFQWLGTPEERTEKVVRRAENNRLISSFGLQIESGEIADGTAWHLCMVPSTGDLSIQNAATASTYWTGYTIVYSFTSRVAWQQDFVMWDWEIEQRIIACFLATDKIHYYLAQTSSDYFPEIPWPSDPLPRSGLMRVDPTDDEAASLISSGSNTFNPRIPDDALYFLELYIRHGDVPQRTWLYDSIVDGVEVDIYRNNDELLAVSLGYGSAKTIVKSVKLTRDFYLSALVKYAIHLATMFSEKNTKARTDETIEISRQHLLTRHQKRKNSGQG